MSRIPNIYRPPLMLPLYWRDDITGELPAAVQAYLNNRIDGTEISNAQIVLLVDWLTHFIHAPCWEGDEQLARLRSSVTKLKTPNDVDRWLRQALEIGLDPL